MRRPAATQAAAHRITRLHKARRVRLPDLDRRDAQDAKGGGTEASGPCPVGSAPTGRYMDKASEPGMVANAATNRYAGENRPCPPDGGRCRGEGAVPGREYTDRPLHVQRQDLGGPILRPVDEQEALSRGIIAPTTRMQRKNIRLARTQYQGRRKYFITLCCSKRSRFFARRELAERAIELLFQTAEKHEFAVHAYCFMPDHIHALVESLGERGELLPFVMDYKRKTTASLAQATGGVLWQKKFYDHILRRTDSPEGAAAYILMNPVRGKLCEMPGDYPFSGSISAGWKNGVSAVDTWVPPWKERGHV